MSVPVMVVMAVVVMMGAVSPGRGDFLVVVVVPSRLGLDSKTHCVLNFFELMPRENFLSV